MVELAHSVELRLKELGCIGGTEDDMSLDEREATFGTEGQGFC